MSDFLVMHLPQSHGNEHAPVKNWTQCFRGSSLSFD